MRSRPPKKLDPEKRKAAAAFIDAAEQDEREANGQKGEEGEQVKASRRAPNREAAEESKLYPWQEPHVREDVNQAFSLRLPEPLYLKLKYISTETGRSMNHMLTTLVEEMVDERLDDVL